MFCILEHYLTMLIHASYEPSRWSVKRWYMRESWVKLITPRAPVAQGIEQRFPKPRVGGSNPSRRTPKIPAKRGKKERSEFALGLSYTNYYTNAI